MRVPFTAMVRRSFRMGLRLGLLFGVGFALFKTMQSRRSSSDAAPASTEPGAWEPLQPDAAEQPPSSVADPAPRTSAGAGSSPANVRPASPPRPSTPPSTPPPALRMPDVPARPAPTPTPPSASSEARAATSTPATPPPVVDEVGEPILEPAPPIEPAPSPAPRRRRATPSAPAGTPPEEQVLNAGVDPALDVVPTDDIVPATRPVRKAAAKKAAAPAAAPAKKAAKAAKKATKAAKKSAPLPGWVEAQDGTCPPTHPVKAKLASRLFHLPGMFAYARTRPDRCYLDADAAVADGFTAAKR